MPAPPGGSASSSTRSKTMRCRATCARRTAASPRSANRSGVDATRSGASRGESKADVVRDPDPGGVAQLRLERVADLAQVLRARGLGKRLQKNEREGLK